MVEGNLRKVVVVKMYVSKRVLGEAGEKEPRAAVKVGRKYPGRGREGAGRGRRMKFMVCGKILEETGGVPEG